LQGNLRDAPGGWSGGMAIVFSGVALIALLALLPRRILRIIDPERLRAMRSARAMAVVDDALREQLVGQSGEYLIAEDRTPSVRRHFRPSTTTTIRARRDGYLYDIRLATLQRVARHTPRGHIDVLVAVGTEVRRGDALASLPDGLNRMTRWRARSAFALRRRTGFHTEQALNRTLDRLAHQGIEAIRMRQEAEWREINDLYRAILVRFPTVTHEFGIRFEGAVSRPGILGFGPTARLLDDLRDDLRETLRVDDPRLADALVHTFLFVADDVASLAAPAIIRDTLGMYVAVYGIAKDTAARTSENATSGLLLDRSERLLFDALDRIGGYELRGVTGDELSPSEAVANLRAGLALTQALLRAMISRHDTDRLRTALRRLREMTEGWEENPQPDLVSTLLREIKGMVLVLVMWAA